MTSLFHVLLLLLLMPLVAHNSGEASRQRILRTRDHASCPRECGRDIPRYCAHVPADSLFATAARTMTGSEHCEQNHLKGHGPPLPRASGIARKGVSWSSDLSAKRYPTVGRMRKRGMLRNWQ